MDGARRAPCQEWPTEIGAGEPPAAGACAGQRNERAPVKYGSDKLFIPGAAGPFGPTAAFLKDLVAWSHRSQVVVPPTEPNAFVYRVLHLDSLLHAIGQGVERGDPGHLLRAAAALVERDVDCPDNLAGQVHARNVDAARHYYRHRGMAQWERQLLEATQSGHIPVVDLETMAPIGVVRPHELLDLRHDANAQRVLQALEALGFDPAELPPYPRGTRDPAKSAARERVAEDGMSAAFFERTWVRLRQAGRIGQARGRDGA